MITSKLKPCCYQCTCPDVEVDTEHYSSLNLSKQKISFTECVIYCGHYKVCKTYIESEE